MERIGRLHAGSVAHDLLNDPGWEALKFGEFHREAEHIFPGITLFQADRCLEEPPDFIQRRGPGFVGRLFCVRAAMICGALCRKILLFGDYVQP